MVGDDKIANDSDNMGNEKAPIKPLSLEPMLISDSKTWNVQLQEQKELPKFLRVSTCISVLYGSGTGIRHGLYVHTDTIHSQCIALVVHTLYMYMYEDLQFSFSPCPPTHTHHMHTHTLCAVQSGLV